ncbi:MAG TPA: dihydrofolate reductase [Planctomycetes bacterium]|nr:dihydrofolate reductase [Planctomycetota bacterium]
MRISLIVATGTGGVIGCDGKIPWHLPADLAHFKRTTMGSPIIMGRRTLESIGGPLPGRRNLVLSRDPDSLPESVEGYRTAEAALESCFGEEEVFVIGGSEIYALFLARAQRIHRTEVEGDFEGDTFFPQLDPDQWQQVSRQDSPADEVNRYASSYVVLERKANVQ